MKCQSWKDFSKCPNSLLIILTISAHSGFGQFFLLLSQTPHCTCRQDVYTLLLGYLEALPPFLQGHHLHTQVYPRNLTPTESHCFSCSSRPFTKDPSTCSLRGGSSVLGPRLPCLIISSPVCPVSMTLHIFRKLMFSRRTLVT